MEELYRSMGVRTRSSHHRLHSVYVRGVDGLSTYEIEKYTFTAVIPSDLTFVVVQLNPILF